MSKLSDRFKDVHEETINSQYNITCKCTDELKTLYNNEDIDSTMLMGKVTHDFWNNFNCNETPFLWGFGEGTQKFYPLDNVEQNISNTTSVCLLRTSTHSVDTNCGIDTEAENTTPNSMKLITDIDTNNIVIAGYASNWDNSVSWWVDDTRRPISWNLLLKVFYKVDTGENTVRLIDMTREISIGVINDNKISSYLDYHSLSRASYAVTNNYGDNTLNFGLQGRNINGNIEWWGSQEKTSKNKTSDDKQYLEISSAYYEYPYYRHPLINAIYYSLVVEIIASLGLPFILCNPDSITTQDEFDAAVHLAYMNDDGEIDYDNILIGRDAIDNSDTKNKDISYDKLPAIDNNHYVDKVDLNKDFFSFAGTAFTKMYALSADDMYQLKRDFMTLPQGFEPLKSIVSVMNFPFDISKGHSSMNDFIIGGQTLPTKQMEMITPYVVLNLGKCKVPRKFNDFRDLSPYTDLKLYVPYCTDVELNASVYMNKTLSVEMIVDLASGQCVACIYCDGIPTTYTSGVIGNDIVLSANGANMKSAAMLQSLLGIGASGLALGSSIATGNAVGAAGSVYGMITSVANSIITGNKNYSSSIGSTQGYVNNIKPQQCYLTISRPSADIPKNYGHTVGFIVNKERTVKDCDGYTVFSNVDTTTLRCNDLQKSRIKSLLESGVYI